MIMDLLKLRLIRKKVEILNNENRTYEQEMFETTLI